MSEWAPHVCPQCACPAYIGFGVNPKCTNDLCQWFDKKTYVEHCIEEYAKAGMDEPKHTGLYRDFCTHCHEPCNFDRWKHPSGEYSAWCPACGGPNYWKTDPFVDEDTLPGLFGGLDSGLP